MRQITFLIISLSLTSCTFDTDPLKTESKMKSTESVTTFWHWFQDNIEQFNNLNETQEQILNELSDQLNRVDDNLVYEISMNKSGQRELIISADGIKESFPSVIELTNAAPEIPEWTITAFRPRVDITQYTLKFNNRNLAAKDFYFWLDSEDQHIDLILFIPELTEDNHNELINASYLLLDMAIGEYDVTQKIRYIDHKPLSSKTDKTGLLPLTELPHEFDIVIHQD